mmetsp:Transcript_1551/g.2332  ORF Transcript_1551/g.2332 Transcript_1551/m.2332 type:complete len:84 (+) Transcript_1551:191-442(+)
MAIANAAEGMMVEMYQERDGGTFSIHHYSNDDEGTITIADARFSLESHPVVASQRTAILMIVVEATEGTTDRHRAPTSRSSKE